MNARKTYKCNKNHFFHKNDNFLLKIKNSSQYVLQFLVRKQRINAGKEARVRLIKLRENMV